MRLWIIPLLIVSLLLILAMTLGDTLFSLGRPGGDQVVAQPPAGQGSAAGQPQSPPPAGQAITLDARIQGEIASAGQSQAYSFTAEPGQQVFVWTVTFDSGMDQIKLRLLDSLGDEVANTCLGCGNIGAQTLRKGGAYTLVVGSDIDPATGAYELKVDPVQ
jgi:hypothetical protein